MTSLVETGRAVCAWELGSSRPHVKEYDGSSCVSLLWYLERFFLLLRLVLSPSVRPGCGVGVCSLHCCPVGEGRTLSTCLPYLVWD